MDSIVFLIQDGRHKYQPVRRPDCPIYISQMALTDFSQLGAKLRIQDGGAHAW